MERHGSAGVPPQRNFTAPPALHLNTGVQAQEPVQPRGEPQEPLLTAQQSPFPPRKSSMSKQDRPDLTKEPPVPHPPRTSSRSASPAMRSPPPSGAASSSSPRLVRPSDIYRRVEDEKEKERKSIDSMRRPSQDSFGAGDDQAISQRQPSFGRNEGDGNHGLQPLGLAPVAERKSEYGFDGLAIDSGAAAPNPSKDSSDTATETAGDTSTRQDPATSLASEPAPPPIVQYPRNDGPPVQKFSKRFSTSPKLPDLTRMSGFGSDFFSGGGFFSGSASPKQPEAPAEATHMPATRSILEPGSAGVTRTAEPARHDARDENTAAQTDGLTPAHSNSQPPPEPSQPKPFRPSLPGTWVSETASSTGEMATPYSEQGDKALNSRVAPISEDSTDFDLKPAPLRTPTPRDRESFSKSVDDDRASTKSGRSSPTKPLRTTASRLSVVEQSDQTPTQKQYTDVSSEVQQTSSEVQQASEATLVSPAPLQPRKSAGDLVSQEPPQRVVRTDTMMTDSSSPLKESDFLRDEIIRSLSPVRGSDSHLDSPDDAGAARESAYLSDVYGDYWAGGDKKTDSVQRDIGRTEALAVVREGGSASTTPTPLPASEPESSRPDNIRRRFSWEAGSATLSPVPSPTKNTHPLPALPQDDQTSPPPETPSLASPVDLGLASPPIAPSSLGIDRNAVETSFKDGHGDSFTSSALRHGTDDDSGMPPSTPTDNEAATANRVTDLFSPGTDNGALDSPTTPTAENQYFTSLDPEPMRDDSPTDVPLPQSPTTPKASDTSPPTSSSQNTMSLKQIMALPTSPERVYKLYETRAEFASTPSGLPEWIAQLLAQPEHANAGPSFNYAPAGEDMPLFANQRKRTQHNAAAAISGSDGVAAPGRRSSITLGGGMGGGGSVRIGSGAQAQLGNLMHGPAGAKGKELLQSAGKMGKGLLSKGKSKLRERAESKKA